MFALAPGQLDVWYAQVRPDAATLQRLCEWLSPEEKARAARYRLVAPRARYLAARGMLRHILALYLSEQASSLVLEADSFGKPFLRDHNWLHFNLSHTDDIVVIAVIQ